MYKEGSTIKKCKSIHEILKPLPEYDYKTPIRDLPTNGIYFFYEDGELLADEHKGEMRIVRVGTHRVDGRFRDRINNHYKGNKNSSIFRKHLGGALIRKRNLDDNLLKQWLRQDTPTFREIENEVSNILKKHFRFKCIAVENSNERLALEEQLIATLSRCPKCLPSEYWLGRYAENELIRESGLWNTQHINSNNIITENAIKRIRDMTRPIYGETKRALFFVPCCSEKRIGGNKEPWKEVRLNKESNRFHFLDNYRFQLLNFYSKLSRKDAFYYYKNRGSGKNREKNVEKAWQKNLKIYESRTMKSIERYNGNLYKAIDQNVVEQLRNGNIDNVLIMSALMGIITPVDLIPDYELMMSDRSPNERKVCDFWREILTLDHIKEHLQMMFSRFRYIYCLMSSTTGYIDSIIGLLSNFESYYIKPLESGQSNKLKSWGKVLSDVIINGYNLPEEVKGVAEKHKCTLKKLDVTSIITCESQRRLIYHKPDQRLKIFKGKEMNLTDNIRKYVYENYIKPAREQGRERITIRAGDVHSLMGLTSRMPAVCSALSRKIDRMFDLEILDISAPRSGYGANFYVTYKIL